ncbi:hypothetical protein [Sediminitomix flava]|uniref:Uncharacterized protein n=1 Tax=Sediminitomix flava TaxID=379075 RepID=A0A315ZHA5_SEDFL|nr:hypothetical protein [Sediminitomix flava]PWJ44966.1 hypothetical protein BC781_1011362 [Sediminitomix flava]
MKGIAINTIRVGLVYRLTNFSETFDFEVLEALEEDNFQLKDLHTLERYELNDLIRYGMGEDFEIIELEEGI